RDLNYSEPATLTLHVKRPWWVYAYSGMFIAGIPLAFGAFYFGKRLQTQRAIAQQFNPYIAGRVVGEDLFYGRSDLITDIERTLANNCFLLYGERRIGKTSLQHQLRERLSKADDPTYRFIPAYIDLQGVAEDDFFRTIATGIVEHAANLFKSSGGQDGGGNGQAASLFKDPLTLRLNEDRDHYSYRDLNRDLRTILNHLKENETKTIKLVLLMDEIDTLNEYSLRTNLNLRGLFMGPLKENLVLVMSGFYLKMDWSDEGGGSPPFNFLSREIQIQPLEEADARTLITEPVKGFYTYEPKAIDHIIELSELRPFTIQGFCLRAVNRVLADGRTRITVDDIEAIKDSVLAEVMSIRGERAGTALPASLNEALALLSEEKARVEELSSRNAELEVENVRLRGEAA
ncbi:ATP-binding protein, partial [Candidatus Poribacteria bacterium]|nr:ATP-binding protein [Candidatus Poribacteria bacterium]